MSEFGVAFYSAICGLSVGLSFIANLLGGWNTSLETLLIFMAADYLTGLICSLILKKSTKTESGGYDSKVGIKGLLKKVGILFMVLIAARLDMILNAGESNYVCTTVIIFFITNEGLSVIENLGIMGIPLPNIIKEAFCKLKSYDSLDNKDK